MAKKSIPSIKSKIVTAPAKVAKTDQHAGA